MADPWVSTMRTPSSNNINIIGANQNFLRSRINPQRSLNSSSIGMVAPMIF